MEEILRHFCFFQLDIVNTLKLKLFPPTQPFTMAAAETLPEEC